MSAQPSRETEIKLRTSSASEARTLLKLSGFRPIRQRIFEINIVFDTQNKRLRTGGLLLRLRKSGKRSILTFKGKAEGQKYKSREEIEVTVSDYDACAMIFSRLGFKPSFRYEKYRTEYSDAARTGLITLDETPIGVFLELEGEPNWINTTAQKLGYSKSDYITATYGHLYLDFCRQKRIKPAHMVFS